jgi:hypothetical protein
MATAKQQTEAPEAPLTPELQNQFAAMLGRAVAQGIKEATPTEPKEGDPEYVARQHAEGWFDAFDVPVFQNAYEAQARGLSADVRKRASNLRPGKYIGGRVTVEVDTSGVRLKYPVSGDNMLKNTALWRDFSDLINKIWDEMHVTA